MQWWRLRCQSELNTKCRSLVKPPKWPEYTMHIFSECHHMKQRALLFIRLLCYWCFLHIIAHWGKILFLFMSTFRGRVFINNRSPGKKFSHHTGFFHCYNFPSLGMGKYFFIIQAFFLTWKGKSLTCIRRKYSGKLKHISNFSWFSGFISGLRPSIKPSNQEKILNIFSFFPVILLLMT